MVRPAAAVEQADLGEASGPFGVRHADPDGNEVDVVPGDPLSERIETTDWQAVFSAMACYRVTSPTQQRDLVAATAELISRSTCCRSAPVFHFHLLSFLFVIYSKPKVKSPK